MKDNGINELEEFYNENGRDMTYFGADENPEKFIEYEGRVSDFVSELSDTVQERIEDNYAAEVAHEYAEKAGEMLAERVEEELRTPFGNPGEGSKSPNFDKARRLLGE